MENRRKGSKIADQLVAAGLLALIVAWSIPVQAAGAKSEESVTTAAISASERHDEAAQTADDTGASGAQGFDGTAGSALPFADIPLAALFLIGVCLLGAGLGPHARRSRKAKDAVLRESHVAREGRAPN